MYHIYVLQQNREQVVRHVFELFGLKLKKSFCKIFSNFQISNSMFFDLVMEWTFKNMKNGKSLEIIESILLIEICQSLLTTVLIRNTNWAISQNSLFPKLSHCHSLNQLCLEKYLLYELYSGVILKLKLLCIRICQNLKVSKMSLFFPVLCKCITYVSTT